MNCKPDQLAWIVVPKRLAHHGVEQLNGRVVRTVRLLSRQHRPVWEVDPQQYVTITRPGVNERGEFYSPGERVEAEGIPDELLRPFDPTSANSWHKVDEEIVVESLS